MNVTLTSIGSYRPCHLSQDFAYGDVDQTVWCQSAKVRIALAKAEEEGHWRPTLRPAGIDERQSRGYAVHRAI